MGRKFTLFILFILLAGVTKVNATNKPDNMVVVSGQIINLKYGSPIVNHKVYVTLPKQRSDGYIYYKEVFTDDEGVYVDTVITNLTKGKLTVYTLDKDEQRIDSTVTFRFFRNTAVSFLIDIKIEMPFHTDVLKARFKYAQKQNGDKFYFRFIDLTNNANIVSRKWSFGDGTYSYEKNPDHTYEKPGIYRVKMTVQATMNGKLSENTYAKMLLIPDRSYFNIGGQVFAGYFPVDMGKAYLYFLDSARTFIPVDTVKFDTLGYYIFTDLPEGEYIIKGQPDNNSIYYGEKCPTYYGNVIKWQQADVCEVNATCWDYDIHLLSVESLFSGEGSIKGNIYVVDKGLKHFGLDSGANITIFLFNKNDQSVTYLYTDQQGMFSFTNLNLDRYNLYPEVTGVKTNIINVQLDKNNPVVDDIVIELSIEGTTAVFTENAILPEMIKNVFPNPAMAGQSFRVKIQLNTSQNVELNIDDYLGNRVLNWQDFLNSGTGTLTIPAQDLPSGVYVISIKDEQGAVSMRKMVIL